MEFASRIFLPLFVHPLFLFVICMMLGIAAQSFFVHSALIFATSTPFALLAMYFFWNNEILRSLLFCLCIGIWSGAYRMHQQKTEHLNLQKTICNNTLDCIGKISDVQIGQKKEKHRITCAIEKIRESNTNDWQSVNATIFIYTRIAPYDLIVGDLVQFNALKLRHPENNQKFNDYLLKEGIAATAFVQKATYSVVAQNHSSLSNWIDTQRIGIVERLRNRFSKAALALFTSLFLGNRAEEKKEQELIAQQSKNWGISHHLARSGLHLVIFVYLLATMLRFLPISLFAKELLLILLCTIYHIFSWSSVSFLRAFLTFLFYKLCTLLNYPSHVLHILTLTCGLILFFNPMQLFFLDFQLSFGLTFTLAWFNAAYRKNPA